MHRLDFADMVTVVLSLMPVGGTGSIELTFPGHGL